MQDKDSAGIFKIVVVIFAEHSSVFLYIFSEPEREFTFAICCRPSVCRLSVCNVRAPLHHTQPVRIFRNFSTPFGSWAIQ